MSAFQDAKLWLVATLGLSKDALHIGVGLTVFLLVAAIFRLRLSDWRPLAAVLLAALLGEAWDVYDTDRVGAPQVWAGNWHDIRNTLFWPLVLFLLARYTAVLKR